MDNKLKELIAIGASISANCQPCLEYHTSKAIEYGVSETEVKEAIDVGTLVRRGAASKMDKFASSLKKVTSNVEKSEDNGCGCDK
ncbi:MAG: carboxymuconolactone decarboxylase family protein [Ignavibacteriae bacterium]|nr:carboxymuconolactone decarboxylase family protein [Ignavibacteriota bacterium]